MSRKKIIIPLLILTVTGLYLFYKANYYLEWINLNSISVTTLNDLQRDKVKIEQGYFTINRKNDAELFNNSNKTQIIFDGHKATLPKTNYGENDFLLTYDGKYYFQFRLFITNRHDKFSFKYILSKKSDSIYIQADIAGKTGMKFTRPMNLISDANKLRCNLPIDDKKLIYNMTELKQPEAVR